MTYDQQRVCVLEEGDFNQVVLKRSHIGRSNLTPNEGLAWGQPFLPDLLYPFPHPVLASWRQSSCQSCGHEEPVRRCSETAGCYLKHKYLRQVLAFSLSPSPFLSSCLASFPFTFFFNLITYLFFLFISPSLSPSFLPSLLIFHAFPCVTPIGIWNDT